MRARCSAQSAASEPRMEGGGHAPAERAMDDARAPAAADGGEATRGSGAGSAFVLAAATLRTAAAGAAADGRTRMLQVSHYGSHPIHRRRQRRCRVSFRPPAAAPSACCARRRARRQGACAAAWEGRSPQGRRRVAAAAAACSSSRFGATLRLSLAAALRFCALCPAAALSTHCACSCPFVRQRGRPAGRRRHSYTALVLACLLGMSDGGDRLRCTSQPQPSMR